MRLETLAKQTEARSSPITVFTSPLTISEFCSKHFIKYPVSQKLVILLGFD